MSTPTMVPMLSPDGKLGDIPQQNMQAAMQAGFKLAVPMVSANGQKGYVPHDRVGDAQKQGFKVDTQIPEQQSHPDYYGFKIGNLLHNVGKGLTELAQSGVQLTSDIGGAILPQFMGGDPITNTKLVQHVVQPMQAEAQKAREERAQGKGSWVGHAIASGIPMVGSYAANLGDQAGTGDIGGAMARGGSQIAAAEVAPKVVSSATGAAKRGLLLGKTPEAAYESAMKPSTTIPEAERASMVQTGLKESIPVSKGGLAKLNDLIDDLNNKITAQIQADPNRPIATVKAVRNLDATRAKFSNQVTPQPDLAQIDSAQADFLNNPKLQPQGAGPGPASLGAADAQAMKQGTYRALGEKAYGELKGARIEAEKSLARGLKDEIAQQFPEINNLNARESQLLDLQPVLERAVSRIGNHQAVGIGTPIAAEAGKVVTGSSKIGAAVGVMKAVLDNPYVKSRLAIAISKGGKIGPGVANARVGAYLASLGSGDLDRQSASSEDTPTNQNAR